MGNPRTTIPLIMIGAFCLYCGQTLMNGMGTVGIAGPDGFIKPTHAQSVAQTFAKIAEETVQLDNTNDNSPGHRVGMSKMIDTSVYHQVVIYAGAPCVQVKPQFQLYPNSPPAGSFGNGRYVVNGPQMQILFASPADDQGHPKPGCADSIHYVVAGVE